MGKVFEEMTEGQWKRNKNEGRKFVMKKKERKEEENAKDYIFIQ